MKAILSRAMLIIPAIFNAQAGPLAWDLSAPQTAPQSVSSNTILGWAALANNALGNPNGGFNNALGFFSMYSNATGNANVAVGYATLANNVTGSQNTAIGADALYWNLQASDNTAIGYGAMRSNTSGIQNTASGVQALYFNTTGASNTAFGYQALHLNTTGIDNTASGFLALHKNKDSRNTANGIRALYSNTSGSNNTASGVNALLTNTTGSDNTAVGSNADVSSGALTNASAIGSGAIVDASNKVRIGNTSVTVIEGQVAFTFPSDRNLKENIRPVDSQAVLAKLRELPVTSWNYIGHDPATFRHYGPMAQDFFAAFGHDEVGSFGTPTTINSADEVGVLMIAVKGLDEQTREKTNALQDKIAALQSDNDRLIAHASTQHKQITALKQQIATQSAEMAALAQALEARLAHLEQAAAASAQAVKVALTK